ncbi:MAG: hypothetical protein HQ515_00640 [Phycisphaeraceae bacterium]|nr:hypothetical protein [Phycisphaeraceae bacterium]
MSDGFRIEDHAGSVRIPHSKTELDSTPFVETPIPGSPYETSPAPFAQVEIWQVRYSQLSAVFTKPCNALPKAPLRASANNFWDQSLNLE